MRVPPPTSPVLARPSTTKVYMRVSAKLLEQPVEGCAIALLD
jgi:hypothetical protein